MQSSKSEEAAAHTAEHLFIRSLQNEGVELTVHVVEQEGFRGTVKLRASHLDWKTAVKAMEATNVQIAAALPVSIVSYPTLREARIAHPALRARDERLEGSVRVVQIGDYDVATCAHEHAKSSREASIFAVEALRSLAGDSYEIEFVTGRDAFAHLGRMTMDLVDASKHLHGRHDHVVEAAERCEIELAEARSSMAGLTATLVRELSPSFSGGGGQVYARNLGAVAEKALLSAVGEATSSDSRLYVLGYVDKGNPSLLVAASSTFGLDCAQMLGEVLSGLGGRGGGKKNFALGGGPGVDFDRAVAMLSLRAREILSENP